MFKANTLLIIGAGAGQEIGLPIGIELSNQIAQKVNFVQDSLGQIQSGDTTLQKLLLRKAKAVSTPVAHYYLAGRQIADGIRYSRSIDEYINKHKDNQCVQYCAKLAIAQTILEAERGSAIFVGQGKSNFERLHQLDGSWLLEFVRILHDGLQKTDITNLLNRLKIISFNYDRSIEQVLYYTLQHSYGVEAQDAADALSEMQIIHPYGYLGKLAWQDAHLGISFGGEEMNPGSIPGVAERIKTFYEQLQDEEDLNTIKATVMEAERIVFLGFGFHPQNVNILRTNSGQGVTTKVSRIYATAFSESGAGCDAIRQSLQGAIGNPIINATGQIHVLNRMKCVDLLREYSRELSDSIL
jgi:hypothetical protein